MFQFRNMDRDKDFIEKFGKNLRQIRKDNNLSQIDLAIKINTDRSQISRIERGIANPTITTIKAIARELDIDIEVLFQFD